MFESLNFFQLVSKGGYTIVILMLCSVISVAVAVEKFIVLSKMKNMSKKEIDAIQSAVASSDIKTASEISQKSKTFLGDVLAEGLKNKNGVAVKESVLRKISQKTLSLEKYLSSLGTIGATAPFIGLLGTVLGIMKAFNDLAQASDAGQQTVMAGISVALIATAAGLFVAIPAGIFYNYYTRKVKGIYVSLESVKELALAYAKKKGLT